MKDNRNQNIGNLESRLKIELYYPNERESIIKEAICCRINILKIIFTLILCISILFALLLFWFEKLRYYFFYSECQIEEATHLAIINEENFLQISEIDKKFQKNGNNSRTYGIVIYNFLRYKIKNNSLIPIRLKYYKSCSEIINMCEERRKMMISNNLKRKRRQLKFGKCIIEPPLKGCFTILIREIL